MTRPLQQRRGGLTAASFAFLVVLLVLAGALAPASGHAQSPPGATEPAPDQTSPKNTPGHVPPAGPVPPAEPIPPAEPVPPAAPAPPPSQKPAPDGDPREDSPPMKLSGRGHLWRWAFVERSTLARAEPRLGARVVTRLSTRTPERTDNLVLVLERRQVDGRQWLRVRLPTLPNNTTGWVRRSALGGYNTVRTQLFIDTRRLRLRLQRAGRTIFTARVGVGQRRWPTPTGRFYVRNELRGFSSPLYGPVAFGTSARSAVLTDWPGGGFIGIHGTNQPGLLPGRVSHGCIRMRNQDILRLARLLPVGTPIVITD